jgi:DUF1680 family protein
LFVNLFIGTSARVNLNGTPVDLKLTTRYPEDGNISIAVTLPKPARFSLNLRIPGWARNQPFPGDLYRYQDDVTVKPTLAVNATSAPIQLVNGFAKIDRTWQSGDIVSLVIPTPVRQIVAHPQVLVDRNCVALERGPLVYCAEGADNDGKVLDKNLSGKLSFQTERQPDLLGGITAIKVSSSENKNPITLIPYYAWCHRGPNEMSVWFPISQLTKSSSLEPSR